MDYTALMKAESLCGPWWFILVFQALSKLMQENHKFEASLS